MLQEKIQNDLKQAMKAGEEARLLLLRGLSAAIHNQEIQKRSSGKAEPLTEEEVIQVLQREAKKRKEAAELFGKGGRNDLKEKEEKELALIGAYLPAQMSREEIRSVVDRLYDAGNKEFTALIKEAIKELKGKAEGGTVSEVIKEKLG